MDFFVAINYNLLWLCRFMIGVIRLSWDVFVLIIICFAWLLIKIRIIIHEMWFNVLI